MKDITFKTIVGATRSYKNQNGAIVNLMKTFADNINDVSTCDTEKELTITLYTPTVELIFEAIIREYIK
jgi:chorismate mutase